MRSLLGGVLRLPERLDLRQSIGQRGRGVGIKIIVLHLRIAHMQVGQMDEIHPFRNDIFLFLLRGTRIETTPIRRNRMCRIGLTTRWLMGSPTLCHANEYGTLRNGPLGLHLSQTRRP